MNHAERKDFMKKRGMIAAAVLAGALGITACAAGTAGGTVTVETAKSHIINVNSSETVDRKSVV